MKEIYTTITHLLFNSKLFISVDGTKGDNALPLYQETAAPSASTDGVAVIRRRFSCMALHTGDRLRFIDFPLEDVLALYPIVRTNWPPGIQQVFPSGGAHELQLKGYPWVAGLNGGDEGRRLMCALLAALSDRGWVVQASIRFTKQSSSRDSLLFRYQNPPPPPYDWLSILFHDFDRLKILDLPSRDLVAAIVEACGTAVKSYGIPKSNTLEMKFHGHPWYPSSNEVIPTSLTVLRLLEALESFGYSVYVSIDQYNRNWGNGADVLYLHRQKDWQPGMPVFHR